MQLRARQQPPRRSCLHARPCRLPDALAEPGRQGDQRPHPARPKQLQRQQRGRRREVMGRGGAKLPAGVVASRISNRLRPTLNLRELEPALSTRILSLILSPPPASLPFGRCRSSRSTGTEHSNGKRGCRSCEVGPSTFHLVRDGRDGFRAHLGPYQCSESPRGVGGRGGWGGLGAVPTGSMQAAFSWRGKSADRVYGCWVPSEL